MQIGRFEFGKSEGDTHPGQVSIVFEKDGVEYIQTGQSIKPLRIVAPKCDLRFTLEDEVFEFKGLSPSDAHRFIEAMRSGKQMMMDYAIKVSDAA